MLECRDVHLGELYIDVMQSKGPKSRRIFISQELSDYLFGYEESINLLFPGREYFFPSSAVGGKVNLPPHGKEFFHAAVSTFLHPTVSTFLHPAVSTFFTSPVSTYFNGR